MVLCWGATLPTHGVVVLTHAVACRLNGGSILSVRTLAATEFMFVTNGATVNLVQKLISEIFDKLELLKLLYSYNDKLIKKCLGNHRFK